MLPQRCIWLCVVGDKNWQIVRKNMLWGVSPQWAKQLRKVRTGDLLLFYVAKPVSSIIGAGVVDSPVFVENNRLPWTGGVYPYRVRLKPIGNTELDLDDPLPLSKFLPKLRSLRSKQCLQRTMIRLTSLDCIAVSKLIGALQSLSVQDQRT